MLKAREKYLHTWASGVKRSRHDYDSPEHLIEEMMSEIYFSDCHMRFSPGDLIYVTDAANQRVTLLINDVDKVTRAVKFSVELYHTDKPITANPDSPDGLSVRWRGPRGGLFCILDAEGKVIRAGLKSRQEADAELMIVRSKAKEVKHDDAA